jgi:cell division inhibitor SepF
VSGMWDRMLTFLGFEEEEPDLDEALPVRADDLEAAPTRDELARRRGRRRPVVSLPGAQRTWGSGRGEAALPAGAAAGAARPAPRPLPSPDLVVISPRNFETAQEVADHLRGGRPVILTLEGVDRELTQRLVHFLSGSVYALGGQMHKVGAGVLLLSPSGLEVRVPVGFRPGSPDG